MRIRVGGTGGILVVAMALFDLGAGCDSSGESPDDGGADGLPISTGMGGAPLDAERDQPIAGVGGALGIAGSDGSGGSGAGGSGAGGSGAGGAGAGGTGVGGTGVGGGGVGGTGVGGSGVGGSGVGGAGVGGSGVGGSGVGGSGVGGAGVGGAGVGGSGVGGAGVGGAGVGGAPGIGGAMSTTDGGPLNDGGVDARPATLTEIWSTILTDVSSTTSPGCITCHDGIGNAATRPNYTSVATTFATLVGVTSTSCGTTAAPRIRVVPGSADTSVLVNKLRAGSGFGLAVVCGGNAMPRAGRSITLDQLHLIEAWVNAGALNN